MTLENYCLCLSKNFSKTSMMHAVQCKFAQTSCYLLAKFVVLSKAQVIQASPSTRPPMYIQNHDQVHFILHR